MPRQQAVGGPEHRPWHRRSNEAKTHGLWDAGTRVGSWTMLDQECFQVDKWVVYIATIYIDIHLMHWYHDHNRWLVEVSLVSYSFYLHPSFSSKKTGAFIRFTKKALLGAVLLTIAPMATLFRGCTCPCTNARIHRFKLVGELTWQRRVKGFGKGITLASRRVRRNSSRSPLEKGQNHWKNMEKMQSCDTQIQSFKKHPEWP